MNISSKTEYSKLKSIVVGSASSANFPQYDQLFQLQMSQAGWTETLPPKGRVAQHIIDETNEDLEILSNTLTSLGITVYRPDKHTNFTSFRSTSDWSVDGQYAYCPRDNFLVIDDMVIETPMSTRARITENQAYTNIKRKAIQDGAKWISAPQPRLITSENTKNNKFVLNELEPVFDAANICRLGNDLIYLVSSSGNRLGAKWLQNILGNEYKIHVTDCYNSAHIDSTITPISSDTVVLNANRVNKNNIPEPLTHWKQIYITEDMINPQSFHKYPYASKWIAINMLALGDNKVICDKNQPRIIKVLEQNGFEVIPLELRHSRTLGGGFHCVTLDLEREE